MIIACAIFDRSKFDRLNYTMHWIGGHTGPTLSMYSSTDSAIAVDTWIPDTWILGLTSGLRKDIQCHVRPYSFSIRAYHHIRQQALLNGLSAW